MTDQPDQPDQRPSAATGAPDAVLASEATRAPGRVVDAERLRVLAAHAGLDLSPDREQALGEAVTELLSDLDHLRTLRLGETPPATAFDARWA